MSKKLNEDTFWVMMLILSLGVLLIGFGNAGMTSNIRNEFTDFKSSIKDSLVCIEYEEVVVDRTEQCLQDAMDYYNEKTKLCVRETTMASLYEVDEWCVDVIRTIYDSKVKICESLGTKKENGPCKLYKIELPVKVVEQW